MTEHTDEPTTGTISHQLEEPVAHRTTEPFLFVVLQASSLGAPCCRHGLGDIDEVLLRRGAARESIRVQHKGKRQLVLTFADPWMSSMHASIRRKGNDWWVEDARSKNGTLIESNRVTTARLPPETVLEVGHTFLMFRPSLPTPANGKRDYVVSPSDGSAPLSTLSPALGRSFDLLKDVAASTIPVLVRGETGTGKELVSQAVHRLSARRGPFVAVNSGAFPPALVESELFGFRKGSFSGAAEDRAGLVRTANGGTLFLDEIGDLPLAAQTSFLRVLQERAVVSIGSASPVNVDFRLVSATHRNLEEMVRQGTFRQDLFARLGGFCLRLPPLRERREDIGLLVAQLLGAAGVPADSTTFSLESARALFSHPWPENIRELGRRLALGVVLAKGGRVEFDHLFGSDSESVFADALGSAGPAQPGPSPIEPLEPEDIARRDELIGLLREHGGNVTAVARAMGKARVQVQRWIRRYGLKRRQVSDAG